MINNFFDYFNDFDVEIDKGKKDSNKLSDQAKLCIFNYDSTGFLENTCKNLPSIMLLGENYLNFINDDFEKKYESFIRNDYNLQVKTYIKYGEKLNILIKTLNSKRLKIKNLVLGLAMDKVENNKIISSLTGVMRKKLALPIIIVPGKIK